MELDKKIKILNGVFYFACFMACLYLVVYFLECWFPLWFLKLDKIFIIGNMPHIFNSIITTKISFVGGREIPMGYLCSSGAYLGLIIACNYFIKHLETAKEKEKEEEIKRKYIQDNIERQAVEREKVKKTQYKDTFYGLLELELKYFDSYEKDLSELEKLKIEYYKMITEKLKLKYPKVEFMVKDKIFFISTNFALLDSITKDILRILNILILTNKASQIKTTTLFSYWMDTRIANKIGIFRALNQINQLGFKNKIVILDEIFLKIEMLNNDPWCKTSPLGTYVLFKVQNGQNVKADLSEITRIY